MTTTMSTTQMQCWRPQMRDLLLPHNDRSSALARFLQIGNNDFDVKLTFTIFSDSLLKTRKEESRSSGELFIKMYIEPKVLGTAYEAEAMPCSP